MKIRKFNSIVVVVIIGVFVLTSIGLVIGSELSKQDKKNIYLENTKKIVERKGEITLNSNSEKESNEIIDNLKSDAISLQEQAKKDGLFDEDLTKELMISNLKSAVGGPKDIINSITTEKQKEDQKSFIDSAKKFISQIEDLIDRLEKFEGDDISSFVDEYNKIFTAKWWVN